MTNKFLTKSLILSICFLVFALTSCEDFQKESYEISEIDNMAKTVFKTSTTTVITAATVAAGTDTMVTPVDPCYFLTLGAVKVKLDDSTAAVILDSMVLKNAMVVPNTVIYRFVTPTNGYISFYVLDVPEEGDYYIYLNDYANVSLIGTSGEEEDYDNSIPLELSSNFFTISDSKPIPYVKARYKFELGEGKYLVKFTTTDQTTSTTFNVVVLED
ncbi:MAG: hypothetical protein PHW79_02085 [Candidatus Marinimicrobia bacterium]|nr:hypothetical protein [Candidatus Neomarinimicrobiota bacterium]